VPFGANTSPSRLIGYSADRGNVEDMQFGTNGDPSGIFPHLLSKTDDQLFSIMSSFLSMHYFRWGP